MPGLTSEQFARVEALFFDASGLPLAQAEVMLREQCGDDPAVAEEVRQMLAHHTPEETLAPLVQQTAIMMQITPADDPKVLVGRRVGAYEVTEILGQGGMGVVYRAHDSRLERGVAIKAVPGAFAADPARMSRFLREAKILASLSHPNIATVYDLAEAEHHRYLVMELIEGQTIASRLANGPMGMEEALSVCAMIAGALEAAHEAGVIHRDLKPQNVMLTSEGRVKVLDFGLAREMKAQEDSVSDSTAFMPRTRSGDVMGTPGYMSPEQLRGQAVDRRTDVFSMGCVLYECLTGIVAFRGTTGADVTAAILEREPDWSLLPISTPPAVRRLLIRSTMKDAARRLRDMGDFRVEVEEAIEAREWLIPIEVREGRRGILRRALPWAIAAMAACAVIVFRPGRAVAPAPITDSTSAELRRFSLPFPGDNPQTDISKLRIALSRDGSQLAVAATEGSLPAIWVRKRDDFDFKKIGVSGGWSTPTFSPDKEWLAYFDDGAIKKKRISGGNPVAVAEVGGWGSYNWSSDQMMTYVPAWGDGIARVTAAGGGTPAFITRLDYSRKEFAHTNPLVTPDNRHALFAVWNGAEETRIEAVEIATRKRIYNIVPNASTPRLAKTPNGTCLLYERAGQLFAAPFDLTAMAKSGPEVVIADGVMTDSTLFTAFYDVADDGTLMYVSGPVFVEESRLSWLEADAATKPFNDDRQAFAEPHFSSDGSKVSVIVRGITYGIHVYDLKQGTFDRVVVDGDIVSGAISPDGKMLAYSSNKDGYYDLWVRTMADGSVRKVVKGSGAFQTQINFSPDSRHLLFSMAPKAESSRDIYYVDLNEGNLELKTLVGTPADERTPTFSPDGKWVAYNSYQSGQREVYVRSFPDGKTVRQVTFGGGDWPNWSADGATLYFRSKGKLWKVGIDPATAIVRDRPTAIYTRRFGQGDFELSDYTIDPKGRVLIVEPSERGPKADRVNVVLNWWRLLEGRK